MNKKDWFVIALAYAVFGVFFWFLAVKAGDWILVVKFMGIMAGGLVTMLACLAAIITTIYFLTVFRSRRYIRFLQKEGYDAPSIDKQSSKRFAILIIAGIFFITISLWLGFALYDSHAYIQRSESPDAFLGKIISILYIGMAGIVGTGCLVGSVRIWRSSQKQLKQYCDEVRSGKTPRLPRFRT